MRVSPQGETLIAVPQVLGHRPDRYALLEPVRRAEVAQRVHPILPRRGYTRSPQRCLPDLRIDVAAVERLALTAGEDQEGAHQLHPLGRRVLPWQSDLDRWELPDVFGEHDRQCV